MVSNESSDASKQSLDKVPKPKEIFEFLNSYVIGQESAKRYLSVAVYNHYKRLAQKKDDEVDIEKSNIVMVGPTGTGKTLLAKTIARLLDVPFTIVDATVLTEAGYVGEDIESLLTRLLQAADYDVQKAERGIVFIDEIDKITGRGGNSTADVARDGVQRDILPIVEGSTVMTKYGQVKTDYILFIAAGAFSMSKPSDLIPELQGRFPIRVELESLTEEDFKRILQEPQNSLVKQYVALLQADGVDVCFTEDGIEALAKISYQVNASTENIGARRLHTVLEKVLEELLFIAPDASLDKVIIDRPYVENKLSALADNEDMSRFIL